MHNIYIYSHINVLPRTINRIYIKCKTDRGLNQDCEVYCLFTTSNILHWHIFYSALYNIPDIIFQAIEHWFFGYCKDIKKTSKRLTQMEHLKWLSHCSVQCIPQAGHTHGNWCVVENNNDSIWMLLKSVVHFQRRVLLKINVEHIVSQIPAIEADSTWFICKLQHIHYWLHSTEKIDPINNYQK